jgi:hypothetical protein
MAARPLIVFSHVDERQLFTSIQTPFDLAKIGLSDSRLGVVN